jgi:2-polyprenyl-3-methyl-5-hydroxy-6-metoxy-1,4-benzoquinol methylase
MYEARPLAHEPFHFANIANSPFTLQYLTTILGHCPRGGRTIETGIGSGHGAIWLSLRGVNAEGIDYNPAIVERARQVNNLIGGSARFRPADLFELFGEQTQVAAEFRHYSVIHHQGVLEHFTVPQIHAALAQQIASADWVVFSVPSVYYPFEPEFGDERLMPLGREHCPGLAIRALRDAISKVGS